MMPSLLPPMSMTALSRWTATTVPLTISPSLPNSPFWTLASKRAAKESSPACCSGFLPAELRAVVSGVMGLDHSNGRVLPLAPVRAVREVDGAPMGKVLGRNRGGCGLLHEGGSVKGHGADFARPFRV